VRVRRQVGEDDTTLPAGKCAFIEDELPRVFDGEAPREIDPRSLQSFRKVATRGRG